MHAGFYKTTYNRSISNLLCKWAAINYAPENCFGVSGDVYIPRELNYNLGNPWVQVCTFGTFDKFGTFGTFGTFGILDSNVFLLLLFLNQGEGAAKPNWMPYLLPTILSESSLRSTRTQLTCTT